jgi:hypothetical protein
MQATVIVACTFAMGAMAGTRSTFPTWLAVPVLALYPLAIAGVAVLDNVLGWRWWNNISAWRCILTTKWSKSCYKRFTMVWGCMRPTLVRASPPDIGNFATRESISVGFDVWVIWVPHPSNSQNYLATNAKSPSVQKVNSEVAFIATIC